MPDISTLQAKPAPRRPLLLKPKPPPQGLVRGVIGFAVGGFLLLIVAAIAVP